MKKTNIVNIKRNNTEVKENANMVMFNQVMVSAIKVGNKYFASVPLQLLLIDYTYQRKTKKVKVANLVKKWDIDKMDALRVSPRKDEGMFAIIDGSHRYSAAKVKQEQILVCEILMDLPEDAAERVKEEARLYATQSDEVNKLTPVEKHNANVLIGVEENVITEKMLAKYNIPLKTNPSHGVVKLGSLAGFTAFLNEAKSGEEHVDNILRIICESRWNIARNGLSALVIRTVGNMLKFHPKDTETVKKVLIKIFSHIEPEQFFGAAIARYPMRKETERLLLWLEDEVCKSTNLERVYTGEKTKRKETA